MRRRPGFFHHGSPRDQAAVTIRSVGHSHMLPDQRLRRADGWQSWQFMFTIAGAGVGDVLGERFSAAPDDVTLMPRVGDHGYQVAPGAAEWDYLWVEFDGACVPPLLTMLGLSRRIHVAGCGQAGPLIERMFAEFEARGEEALHEMTGVFLQALALVERAARVPAAHDARAEAVERAKRCMTDRLAEALRLEDVAAAAGVSPFHLVRVFREREQATPMAWLRRLRASRAKALLHRADLKAAEVGRRVGYPALPHFSRMFKAETGMTLRRFVREVVRQRPARG